MGFIKSFFILFVPSTAMATYFSFRLGSELPVACKKFGRKVGMGYNYFKVILKVLSPQ